MKIYRGSFLMEGMICVFILGIFIAMGSSRPPKGFLGSADEAPVMLLGLLNEEMRESASTMKGSQIRLDGNYLFHVDHKQVVKKRIYMEDGLKIYYGSYFDPRFTSTTSFSFLINGTASQSGRISFYRNGKVERDIMVHLGTLTMDIRSSNK